MVSPTVYFCLPCGRDVPVEHRAVCPHKPKDDSTRSCRECGATTVPCWLCEDGEPHDDPPGIAFAKPVPLTDEIRDVVHVGICPHHGVVQAACPNRTHITRPSPRMLERPSRENYPPQAFIRAAAAGLFIGVFIGIGVTIAAWLALRIAS